jgi:SAM-dependent methyltransferase
VVAVERAAHTDGPRGSVESPYDGAFYDEIDAMSVDSAAAIVPWLVDALSPTSVIDVGCGRGAWLAEFKRRGVADVLGVDGDYLDVTTMHISEDEFVAADLLDPPVLDRTFDVAVSLEVGEHLPAEHAASFVDYLCQAAPVVLFSAAIPGQGGVHHVNEQWPAYWSRLFANMGYKALDVVRPRFWDDDRVAFYFAQNTVIYASEGIAANLAERLGPVLVGGEPMALAHPKMVAALEEPPRKKRSQPSVKSLLRALPGASRRAIKARVRRGVSAERG